MSANFTAIPECLRCRPQWVNFKLESRRGEAKPTKVPYCPRTGRKASATAPAMWSDFQTVIQNAARFDGLGFVFTSADPFVGIDLDHAVENGQILPWAQEIVTLLASYAEFSPSGTGVHIIVEGALPSGGRKTGNVEMYETARYFTVTGNVVPGSPTDVKERSAQLRQLHARIFSKPSAKPASRRTTLLPNDDAALLQKARSAKDGAKFTDLYDRGDVSAFDGDESRADLALCSLLLFWTGGDIDRADRLFRGSALFREKWDSPRGLDTYGAMTLTRALEGKTDFHTPSHRQDLPSEQTRRRNMPAQPVALDAELAGVACTDLGNAERLAARFGTDLRYCHLWAKWLLWDGTRWRPDETGNIVRYAMRTVRSIYAEVATIPPANRNAGGESEGQDKAAALAAWAKKSESKERLAAMINLAQSLLGIAVHSDAFDADHWKFNCASGTIDLRTGRLHPHRREDLITRFSPVPFNPEATAPRFDAFLERVLPDADVRAFVQRAAGYTLTGDISEQVLFFLYGLGKNGKSVFTGVLEAALGDFWTKTRSETIMRKRDNGGIPNDVAALVGRRLVTVSELEQNQSLNEALVKDMTGGDMMSARFMRAEFFNFRPVFKMWLYGNHKPTIRGTDEGIWRRIRLIHFGVTIPENERDTHLPDKLRAELPGILAWAVRGCLEWQQDGLREPASVIQATQAYREDMDVLAAFLGECCIVQPRASVTKAALWAAYETWCQTSGDQAFRTQRAFNDVIKVRPGIQDGTSGHSKAKTWFGIGLTTEKEPPGGTRDSDVVADCAVRADRISPLSKLNSPRVEINPESRSAQSARSASPLVLEATETQQQSADSVAKLRQQAHDGNRRSDEDHGVQTNYQNDYRGALAEICVRQWLENNGVRSRGTLYAEHPVKEADIQVGGITFEVKSSRAGYNSLAISKKQHDTLQPAPDFYLPVLFIDEKTMTVCKPIPHKAVDSWQVGSGKNNSRFYYQLRTNLEPLTGVEDLHLTK